MSKKISNIRAKGCDKTLVSMAGIQTAGAVWALDGSISNSHTLEMCQTQEQTANARLIVVFQVVRHRAARRCLHALPTTPTASASLTPPRCATTYSTATTAPTKRTARHSPPPTSPWIQTRPRACTSAASCTGRSTGDSTRSLCTSKTRQMLIHSISLQDDKITLAQTLYSGPM